MKKPAKTLPASEARADKSGADLRARFATPIETDRPVNPDGASKDQFTQRPAAERKADKSR